MLWRSLSLLCCEWCFDLTPTQSILFFFYFLSLPFLLCHWNSSFSFKSYCICLVSINLTLSSCSFFHFFTLLHPFFAPSIPLASFPPGPATTLVFPKSSAIRHLQWNNHTVLTQLDWASNICTPPSQTLTLLLHLHPLTEFKDVLVTHFFKPFSYIISPKAPPSTLDPLMTYCLLNWPQQWAARYWLTSWTSIGRIFSMI